MGGGGQTAGLVGGGRMGAGWSSYQGPGMFGGGGIWRGGKIKYLARANFCLGGGGKKSRCFLYGVQ